MKKLLFLLTNFVGIANAGVFNPYIGGYMTGTKSTASILESRIKDAVKKDIDFNVNSKISPSMGINGGLEMDFLLVKLYLEGFAEGSFGKNDKIKLSEKLTGRNISADFEYKKTSTIGARLNLAINLFLFDIYFGGGVANQKGKVQSNFDAGELCNISPGICDVKSNNFSTKMFTANVGLQKKFKKFAIFMDVTAYFPQKVDIKDANIESLLISQSKIKELHKIHSSNVGIKMGARYYL
jgi:hypothetical protein